MGALEQALERQGIRVDPKELACAVEEALKAAGGPPYPLPEEHLSPEQLHVLKDSGFELEAPALDAEDPVLLGALEYAVLRSTGLTTREAGERLGVNDSRVRQRLGERRLYGIKRGDGWRLPAFQFTPDGLVPGIDRVLVQLDPGLSPVAVYRWLVIPNPDLAAEGREHSPLQWLLSGRDPEAPAELARWL